MTASQDLLRFVRSSFRSVWALEILLFLKREQGSWTRDHLVDGLRASEQVVTKAIDGLLAAGLISLDDGGVTYMPVNGDVADSVNQVEKLYTKRPDAVRRAIVSATDHGATAFADAFKLRKD